MSIVIREQDILKKPSANGTDGWNEESIRAFQESNGINYGATVFQRGMKPHREWSNDREFNQTIEVTEVDTSALKCDVEKDELRAELESMKAMLKKLMKEETHEPQTGVDRHGLEPTRLDKRSKEYRDSLKA